MRGWGLVIGLLAAVTLLALALKAIPPGVLMVGVVAGGGYGAYRFSRRRKAAKRRDAAELKKKAEEEIKGLF